MFEELASPEKYMKYVFDEGFQSGIKETEQKMVKNFTEAGMSPEEIAQVFEISLEAVEEYLK